MVYIGCILVIIACLILRGITHSLFFDLEKKEQSFENRLERVENKVVLLESKVNKS